MGRATHHALARPALRGETAQLISSLSDRPVMAGGDAASLLERAGGNPLYAEQYVRMLEERGSDRRLALPETVQGIIAARLDALPSEEKRLLQSAAVIGKVFWLGALTQVGALDRRTAEMHLHALERKDFVQRARRSSVAEEAEYSFLHVLVRDVAYGQIPRGRRAEHAPPGGGMDRITRPDRGPCGDARPPLPQRDRAAPRRRPGGRATRWPSVRSSQPAQRRRSGRLAQRLRQRNPFLSSQALQLTATGPLDSAQLLFKLGRTQFLVGAYEPVQPRRSLREAAFVRGPRDGSRGGSCTRRDELVAGRQGWALSHMRRARELVADLNPSRSTAYVLSRVAGDLMLAGESAEAIRLASEALATAEKLGIDELRAHAMHTLGASRISRGDAAGIMDLERSAAIAMQANAAPEICMAQGSLASSFWNLGQLTRAWRMLEESEETASRFGLSRGHAGSAESV